METLTLYRAMSEEEFEILRTKGFRSTFRKNWKYFSTSPEYVYIVTHELNYGKCPDIKYSRVVRFRITLRELPQGFVRFFKERGYTNVAINSRALPFITDVKWEEVDKESLPEPEPVLVWVSKSGKVVKLYDEDKAREVLTSMRGARERIIHAEVVA